MKECFSKNLIMSEEEEEEEETFQLSNKCWICGKLFDLVDEKVRDHCHIFGKFRGAAHYICNANLKIAKKVPVVFHSLKGYDGHLIIKEMTNFDVSIDVIPNGLEKYMAFIVNKNLVFIDSKQFMNSSLDSLVKNLADGEFDAVYFDAVKEKGKYPYGYADSFKKLDETELCSEDNFYSSLKDENISEKYYERAKSVWKLFNIKNLGEYHDLYLKSDVLLLCDVFGKFISTSMACYGLDPCHYFSSPGLSWDAMLKMAGVELELIDDIDMHLFIEKGMRDGVSYIAKRYSKANNKYMSDYDGGKENVYIMYSDANNLHGWAMMQYLPYGGFKWLTKNEINKLDLGLIKRDSLKGYIFEVDLEYCNKLHDFHNDYPSAPEKLKVSSDMLSKYCYDIANEYEIKVGEVNKLIPNLRDKKIMLCITEIFRCMCC